MNLVKRAWHDPVWSKVIAGAIIYGGAQLARHWPAALWPPVLLASANRWFDTPITITLTRGDLVNWPMQAAAFGVSLTGVVLGLRNAHLKRIALRQTDAGPDVQPAEREESKTLPKFEPEKFELTGPRCRALLALLERVDARNTLHELYQFVIKVGPFVDRETSKGQLQHDMEEAERVGIVSIERVSPLTHCYSLTAPEGRDWVLRNKAKLQARAPLDMERTDPRAPYG